MSSCGPRMPPQRAPARRAQRGASRPARRPPSSSGPKRDPLERAHAGARPPRSMRRTIRLRPSWIVDLEHGSRPVDLDDLGHVGRRGAAVLELHALRAARCSAAATAARDAGPVGFVDLVARVHEPVGQLAVVGQQDQAAGCRRRAGRPGYRRAAESHQVDHLWPPLRVVGGGHHADRLVDEVVLERLGRYRLRRRPSTSFGRPTSRAGSVTPPAVHAHAAGGHEPLGVAARGHAGVGEVLGQPHGPQARSARRRAAASPRGIMPPPWTSLGPTADRRSPSSWAAPAAPRPELVAGASAPSLVVFGLGIPGARDRRPQAESQRQAAEPAGEAAGGGAHDGELSGAARRPAAEGRPGVAAAERAPIAEGKQIFTAVLRHLPHARRRRHQRQGRARTSTSSSPTRSAC